MDETLQDFDGALEDLIRYDQAEWQEWGGGEDEYEFEAEYEEETEEIENRSSESRSTESDADFGAAEVEKRKESILRRQTEKKTEAIKKLLAGSKNKKQTTSVETIITLEDEIQTASLGSNASSSNISYPFFKSIDISDSQLKLMNLFNTYPVPEDPDNVRAFWTLYDPPPQYANDGIKRFADIMKTLNLRPIACMSDLLRTDVINLRYYGLDPRAVKAVCESVYNSSSVQSLDLKVSSGSVDQSEDNWLTPEACLYLNNLLLASEILAGMNLSGCKIGGEGIQNMLPGIAEGRSLVELNLSHCRLENEGFKSLASVVENHERLKTLNLSDNQLGTECAQALQAMLAHNSHLLNLDLSWNGLFTKEASNGLFKGLLENKTLVSLDLSWNAFGKETLPPLNTFLQQNQTLVTLNLSGNRFDELAGGTFAKSLTKNVGLRELYLGNNPLKPAGGSAIVHALIPEQSPHTGLRYVDLENVWVNKEVLPDLEKIESNRPWLRVKLGGIFSNYKLIGPDEKKIFFKRAIFEGIKPKNKKQRRDFGHFILSLEERSITRENFKQLVKAFKIKLSDTLVDALMAAFPGANKKVDQVAMKAVYLEQYPDTTAPPPPAGKKKKGKEAKPGSKKQKELVDNKAEETMGKSKKRKGKTVTIMKTPFSEYGTEESDEFKGEEAYED